ncbi:MAG: hypothetical protein LC623_08455, partial [Halobacteriales archaeon]|nr:hypothetical protein [Halobacteriales archaeon]
TFYAQSLTDQAFFHTLAYRVTNITGQPEVRDILQLGEDRHVVCEIPQACAQAIGDHSTRFDYCSITILSDGRLAISYVDDSLDVPAVAVEI